MMYRCDNCDHMVDDDYHPQQHPFGATIPSRADEVVCPSCYDDLMIDMLEALEEDHGM